MPSLSTYAEAVVINALIRATNFTAPTTVYLALYTSNPTAADVGAEISFSGSNYARQPIVFGAPSGGFTSNTTDISFDPATSTWGVITHAAIRDAATAGHLLFYGALVLPRSVIVGDVIKFLTGNVSVTVS